MRLEIRFDASRRRRGRSPGPAAAGRAFAALTALACVASACTGPWGRRWDFDLPTARRVGKAALDSALSPEVLAPAVGAAVFQIDEWDEKVSDWAVRDTPIFGDIDRAKDASDILQEAVIAASATLVVVTPTGEDFSYDWRRKAFEVGSGVIAGAATTAASEGLKLNAGRERPDGTNHRSFPSGHASSTAVATALARRCVDRYPIPRWARWTAHGVLVLSPYATGWARVEAQRHFPADVLAGVAIGNFFGIFVNELLEVDPSEAPRVSVGPTAGGMAIGLAIRW